MNKRFYFLVLIFSLLSLSSCERPDPEVTIVASPFPGNQIALVPTPIVTPRPDAAAVGGQTVVPTQVVAVTPLPTYVGTPTPDPPHPVAAADQQQSLVRHYVNAGETLGYIAQLYGSSLAELLTTNQLNETEFLYVGQEILIPNQPAYVSPSFKIVPDSELVYGPALKGFDVSAFAASYQGYLMRYEEIVEGAVMPGPAIVQLVADRYSVSPRLLLAVLEYRAGWVTGTPETGVVDNGFPMGYVQPRADGLYRQLSWAADELNSGYYGRSQGRLTTFLVGETTRVAFAADINDGTAGMQKLMGAPEGATYQSWLQDVGPEGVFATYQRLFGNPFAYTVDPLWPSLLVQPPLRLPWADGETWYLTGGPHGGWDTGSAWAALDFVPFGEQLGCVQSDTWVTAMIDGLVVRSDHGAVVVDLDGDGYAGTGWAITYMHLETRDRIGVGTFVQTGDRLGHPSCEGGFSNGTHVHISRTYNGRWVEADGPTPFTMSGWIARGLGREYDGLLIRGSVTKEACECREEINAVLNEP